MTTKTRELTIDDIEAGYANDGWLGFGYLGERQRYAERDDIDEGREVEADVFVLETANQRGWSRDQLFQWMNSRDGRHFGDLAFGGWSFDELQARGHVYFRGW
jgi:hypothetical protein